MPRGCDKSLYILPFDHRGTFEARMAGREGDHSPEQTAEIGRRHVEFAHVFDRVGAA
jgi:hypothetical protein